MKAKLLLTGIITVICVVTINIVNATTPKFATPSHPNITRTAIEYFKNIDAELSLITSQDLSSLYAGSEDEDNPPRWVNHYFDYFHQNNNGGGYEYYWDSAKQWAHDN